MKIISLSVGIVAVLTMMVASASSRGNAQGQGQGSAPVTVVNTPLPVSVETPVTVAGAGTPAQIVLKGSFEDNSVNLQETTLGPITYTIPDGFSRMLLRHVSCRAFVASGRKVQSFLNADVQSSGGGSSENLIELIPDNEIFGALPQARQVAHAKSMPSSASRRRAVRRPATHSGSRRSAITRREAAASPAW